MVSANHASNNSPQIFLGVQNRVRLLNFKAVTFPEPFLSATGTGLVLSKPNRNGLKELYSYLKIAIVKD